MRVGEEENVRAREEKKPQPDLTKQPPEKAFYKDKDIVGSPLGWIAPKILLKNGIMAR